MNLESQFFSGVEKRNMYLLNRNTKLESLKYSDAGLFRYPKCFWLDKINLARADGIGTNVLEL